MHIKTLELYHKLKHLHLQQGLRLDREELSFPNNGKHVDTLVEAEELVGMAQVALVHKEVQEVQEEVDGYI
jgi:hypothetical protein